MDYKLKLGKVISTRNLSVMNVFKVKIIPDMEGIDESMLPTYPNFFSTNNYAYSEGSTVWTLVNDDFQVGFILGLAQPPAGENITSFIEEINDAEEKANLPKSGYNELSITKVGGSSVSFINDVRGTSGHIYNNRTVIIFNSNGAIWIKNPGLTMAVSSKGEVNIEGKTLNGSFTDSINLETNGNFTETSASTKIDSRETVINSSNIIVASGNQLSLGSIGDTVMSSGGKIKETIVNGKDSIITVGNLNETVALGNYSLKIGIGNIDISAGVTRLTINPLTGISLYSPTAISIKAPSITLPMGLVVPNPAGGPFNCIPYCPMTGLPHQGTSVVGLGV